MKNETALNILRKINYIEADIEIQKQILFSLASHEAEEIETIVTKIALAKKEVDELRAKIKTFSPEQYQKILTLEKAITEFQKLAKDTIFTSVESMSNDLNCSIQLHNGEKVPCLVKACDEQGNWSVITTEGEIKVFSIHEIMPMT